MKRIYLLAIFALIFLPGSLFGYSVLLYDFTGADAEVKIDISGTPTSMVFDVTVIKPAVADLRGVWFNFDPFPDLSSANISISGANVTGFEIIKDGVVNFGGGATINPEGPFDAGVEIGLSGVGGGDYFHSTTFSITSSSPLFLGDSFGARLMSIPGDPGSSTLVGNYDPTPVPESPAAATLVLGMGLIGLAGFYGNRTRFKRS